MHGGDEDRSDFRGGSLDGRRVQGPHLPEIRREVRDETANEGLRRPDAQKVLAA